MPRHALRLVSVTLRIFFLASHQAPKRIPLLPVASKDEPYRLTNMATISEVISLLIGDVQWLLFLCGHLAGCKISVIGHVEVIGQ
jgi:hypothetical protein